METKVELRIIKENDNLVPVGSPPFKVSSHWNNTSLVNIQIGDGSVISVNAKELRMAIDNATNNS